MTILRNVNLKPFHTFGFNSKADQFVEVGTVGEVQKLVAQGFFQSMPFFVLGGGSNVLFKSKVDGLVVHPVMKGIKVISQTGNDVVIEAMAGEEWDDLVAFCVDHGFGGIENLSLIPGNVGAAPVQNIGAYGVEVCDVIDTVFAVDLTSGKEVQLKGSECAFGYRDSIFKNSFKNKVILTKVWLTLTTKPCFKMDYGQVAQKVQELGETSLKNIREAIVGIRQSKLPDPTILGNAGSFFKNPVVDNALAAQIRARYNQMPEYPVDEHTTKIPAGWLIETSGWKGRSMGYAAVHQNQALVLVNLGNATCEEVLKLADAIVTDVEQKFGICLEKEVNVVG